MSNQLFIDLHCHTSIKPYGRSIKHQNQNSNKPCRRNSIWHRRPANVIRRLLNRAITITRFTQSDFKTLARSGNTIICASLAPLERGFFTPKLGEGIIADILTSWVTGIGKKKVDFIQENKNYYAELNNELDFFKQQDDRSPRGRFKKWKYQLVENYTEVEQNQSVGKIISVITSIEGAHAFITNNQQPLVESEILNNVDEVVNWKYKPLFVAPAHHFYNHLCGHAYSLSAALRKQLNQDEGVNTGITPLGAKVIRKLLDNKVFIDIKHMSRIARREFYAIHGEVAYSNTPIIASHAAVNGYASVYFDEVCKEDHGKFFGEDINIFDDELVKIATSGGLFGVQLDERRIASKDEMKKIRWVLFPWNKLKRRAGFVWSQISHVAKVLDAAGKPAFDNICVGSDYDGIVDPINGYWTAKQFSKLKRYMLKVAGNDIADLHTSMQQESNKLSAPEILDKFFRANTLTFLKNHFI